MIEHLPMVESVLGDPAGKGCRALERVDGA
jgi:hypothetical protein